MRRVILALLLSAIASPSATAAADKTPENGGIVFTGSSIFAFWAHLTEQMAPLPVLNRSIPGTVTQDMLNQIDRLVLRYNPRIVVYYCGSNDISAGESVESILERTQRYIKILHEKLPETRFFYTSIHKAPEKRDRWDAVEAVNRAMERYSHQVAYVGFIDLNPVLFDAQGKVRDELFLPDGLHFRPASSAYPEFARIVRLVLEKAWKK